MKKSYSIMILIVLVAIPLIIFAQDTTKVYKVDSSKCIGCTICVQSKKCPTDAIEMKNGKAVIDPTKCIDCGICTKQCPVSAIYEVEYIDSTSRIKEDIAPEVKDSITVEQASYVVDAESCIGCKICVRKCPVGAISMKNSKAVIDTEKCINCGICVNACPVKAIHKTDE